MGNLDLNFTQKQKEAALFALHQIARSDNDLAENEINFLKRIGESIGEVFNHLSISSLITGNSSNQISELKNLSKSQK